MSAQTSPSAGRRAAPVVAAALLAVAAVLLVVPASSWAALAVNNLAQLAAALFAAVTAGRCAHRTAGRRRQAWTALAVGCAGWAAGQGVWSWYELVLDAATPFPSLADVGFLAFPVGAALALWLHPTADARGDRRRRVLDGLTIMTALLLVSWATALGAVVREGGTSPLASAVGAAYPASDVVLLVMVVLLLGRPSGDRRALALVGSGVAAIAVADSAFLYLTATGAYSTDAYLVSLGWCLGFALLGLAALAVQPDAGRVEQAEPVRPVVASLPYVPLAVAAVVVAVGAVDGRPADPVEVALATATLALVLVRQYATVRDNTRLVAELAAREAELRHRAFHDGLTGLANRALFRDRVAHALELHERDRRPAAVLFCDLDDFKVVNDTLGHAVGDDLLVRVAERLRGALRSADTLARLGGDEFAVLLEDSSEPVVVAQKVVDALRAPFTVADRPMQVRVSVGVTSVTATDSTPSADDLLSQADTAMYAAKRQGKDALRAYVPGMALAEVADSALAGALERAVAARQVELAYQPIVDVRTGRVDSVEALARWTRDGVPVPPSAFVPLAERSGLIGPLTELVLDLACEQAAAWRRDGGHPRLRVAVNLSPASVTDPALPGRVRDVLRRHGVPGTVLTLEITETALLADAAAARDVCTRLHALGVRLSLDDFGTGFSSLAHLHALPLDRLKVDKAFVDLVDRDDDQRRFTRAVLRLGADLGLDVVAEGVERAEQVDVLSELGCGLVQGYLLGRPAPAPDTTPLLDAVLLPRPQTSVA